MQGRQLLLLVILFVGNADAAVWDANNYPNPTTQTGAKQCGLKSAGNLCDPDGVLTESERYRVNHELSRLESKTYQEFGRDFCEKKGLTGVIGLAKSVKGGTETDVRRMATDLRQRWSLDTQCLKGLVIIVSVDDRKFWVSRDSKVPVYAGEFSDILNAQTPLFRDKNYQQALLSIIQQTTDKTLTKQGQLPAVPPGDAGRDRGGGRKDTTDGGTGGAGGFKFPKIPLWVILAIVCVVIPTLLCCCCIYCCCCRNKDSGPRRQGASDVDPEAPRQSGGGGMGDRLRSVLGGAGGGALMSVVQNWFRNRGASAQHPGQQPPPYGGDDVARGNYIPQRPLAEEGKGLYPSKEVKDDGAGGGW